MTPGDRTAVVVSGMHRSGTSALTRVLSLLGAALPEHLIEGRPDDNEPGFWEGRLVVDLDQRILQDAGSWWGGWQRIETGSLRGAVNDIRRLVVAELGDAGLVAVKDPRLSRLLPLWTTALEEERRHVVHVVAVRSPGEVAGSVGRRNGLGVPACSLSWLAHMLDAELATRDRPRVFVAYDALLGDWRREVDRMAATLDLAWPRAAADVSEEIDGFLDPSLRHGRVEVVDELEPVYAVLRRWAADDERPGDRALLDAWRERLAGVRDLPSPTSLVSRRRREAGAAADRAPVARALLNQRIWGRIEQEAFDLEAQIAWPAVVDARRELGEAR